MLNYGNCILAQRLLAEPRGQIYVTYGAKHLPGVFAILRATDPRWRVSSIKRMRTIDSSESYDSRLPGIPNA
ncbi:hypothetical protein [Sphingobium boeckii]|uniref:Uncharacterized protein n=1 Tax=Sphingobium boeckii TaxID=1082345 RepID=A0A7W9AFV5_9SPHN|nr:hypothetical protein [Sphingobium boeckii]MBB5684910.1 hypothetical protein [Sphingobium boeckii]